MADTIRRVSYYYTTIPDKPGEGTRLLDALRRAGVNLLALHAFPSARKAQVDFVPSDAAVLEAAAKGAKIKLSKPKTAFLVDGDDRVGALAGVLGRLASAKVNVTAVTGLCAGMGRYGTIRPHRVGERPARLAGDEIRVAQLYGDRAGHETAVPEVGACPIDQREQPGGERLVIVQVGRERLVAADRLGLPIRLDRRGVVAADPPVQPRARALAQPADQGLTIMPDDVADRAQAKALEPFLEPGPDGRQVGEREPQHELRLRARRDHVHSIGRRTRSRLRHARGELRHELGGRAADRQGQRRFPEHRRSDAPRRRRQGLPPREPFRAREIQVEAVDRGL